MSLGRRITSGLAWAGLALVIAVPSADFVTSQFIFEPVETTVANAAPAADAAAGIVAKPRVVLVKPAIANAERVATTPSVIAAEPAAKIAAKPLPSYLTGGEAEQTADAPRVVILPTRTAMRPQPEIGASPAAPTVDPVEVGTVTPAAPAFEPAAPVPMPAEMRPRTSILASVVAPSAQQSSVLIIDTPRSAAVQPTEDFVSADELDNWESGPLSDFLAQRQGRSVAAPDTGFDAAYDRDGFFLEDGPNAPQQRRPLDEFPVDEFLFSFGN